MRQRNGYLARALKPFPILLLAAAVALAAASCGGESGTSQTSGSSTKLPPGATAAETESGTDKAQAQAASDEREGEESAGTADSSKTSSNTAAPTELVKTIYLSGANIAMVSVSRDDSNEAALTSGTREVSGDFLLIEMSITNVDDELVDLSKYSFRLSNPAIDADQYEGFYGSNGTYGSYVSEHVISATLLDYETLLPVSYSLRIGETVDNAFLFFDLNPQSTAKNAGVTMASTKLIIHDTETGDEAEMDLSGYAAD